MSSRSPVPRKMDVAEPRAENEEVTVDVGRERKPEDSGCTVHEGLQKLVQLLPRITRGMRRRPTQLPSLGHSGLGARHSSAIALLRQNEATVGSLAVALDLNLATVSGLVADLERAGFVERSADSSDRRRTIVRMTPGSKKQVDEWLDGTSAPIVRALQLLSPEERVVFVKALVFLDEELNQIR